MAYINNLAATKLLKGEGAMRTSTKSQLAMSSKIRQDTLGKFDARKFTKLLLLFTSEE